MDTSKETGSPHPRAANSTAAASAPETRCRPERPGRGASRDGLTWPLGGLSEPTAANQGKLHPRELRPVSYRRSSQCPDEGEPLGVLAELSCCGAGRGRRERVAEVLHCPLCPRSSPADPWPPSSTLVLSQTPSSSLHSLLQKPSGLNPFWGRKECKGPERGGK